MPDFGFTYPEDPQQRSRCPIKESVATILIYHPTGRRTSHSHTSGTVAAATHRQARLDIATLDFAVEQYFSAGLAPSTRRVYEAGSKKYLGFCEQLHYNPIPTSEQLLCKFVAYLATKDISATTIKVYLSAVRQLHLSRNHSPPDIASMPCLQQVIRGIRISQAGLHSGKASRLPITPAILQSIRTQWQGEPLNQDRIMLWAAFTTCFFGFLRAGEICTKNPQQFNPSAELAFQDVAVDDIRNPQAIKMTIKASKTDPFREGVDIQFQRTNNDLCPVAALLTWLVNRGSAPGPLFQFSSGAPLTRATFVVELKKAITESGHSPEGFSGHSFRAGAATTAANNGISDAHIKLLGRWKSSAYQRYIRPSPSNVANLWGKIADSRARFMDS